MGQLVGVGIELLGTLLSVLGLNAMKYTAMSNPMMVQQQDAIISGPKMAALLIYTCGQLTETVALAFGNSAVLSACSASALVWNAFLANRLFHEKFTPADATATVAICLGIVGCAVTGPPSHDLTVDMFEQKAKAPAFIAFCSVLLAVVVGCLVLLHAPRFQVTRDNGEQQPRGNGAVLYSLLTASVGSFCYFLGSVNSQLIKKDLENGDSPGAVLIVLLVVFVGLAISNLIFINTALGKYEALIFVPIYYVLNILCTVLGCLVFYDDFQRMAPPVWHAAVFGSGVLCILVGVRVLSLREAGANTDEFTAQAADEELLSPCGLHVSSGAGRDTQLERGLTEDDLDFRAHRHTATLSSRTGLIGCTVVLPPTRLTSPVAVSSKTLPETCRSNRNVTTEF